MSILDVWITDDRALVGVNTEVSTPDGKRQFEMGKLLSLIHINAVLSCRGNQAFFAALSGIVLYQTFDFDELVDKMLQIMARAFESIKPHAASSGLTESEFDGQEIVIVGWSPGAKKMRAFGFAQKSRADGFKMHEFAPSYVSPADGSFYSGAKFDSPDQMAALARAQSRWLRGIGDPAASGGGHFVIAELEKQRMTIEQVCDL